MSGDTRRGLVLLLIAAGLGLLGDLILRAIPLGLNVGLWVAALVAGFVVLGALNALNPDELIARTNLARIGAPVASESGQQPFDYQYTLQLSADAVPALVESLPQMSPAARRAVDRDVLRRWGPTAATGDWRRWNWGRSRAVATARQSAEALTAAQ